MSRSKKIIGLTVLTAALSFLGSERPGSAASLYVTSLEGSSLNQIDLNTNTTTAVYALPSGADSLVFDSSGNIIYTSLYTGEVRLYNTTTHANTVIAGGFSLPADLVMDPGGHSVLVSEYGGGKIDRINLSTHAVSTLLAPGGNPEGLAYDSAGHLFANLGVRSYSTTKYVAQLDPVTGAVLQTSASLYSLDGLTYDSVTNKLYAASLFGNGIYAIDPTNLNASPLFFGLISNPDGITSDGTGNIFIASRGSSYIYQYDTAGHTLTPKTYVYGLDDLAPAAGLGAPPSSVPEPSTLLLLGSGITGFAFFGKKRLKK